MKILLYSLIFAPDVCSNAYVFSDLSKGLRDLGHEVAVITTTPHYDEDTALEKRKLLSSGKKDWYMKSTYDGMNVYHIVVAPKKGGIKQRINTYYRFHRFAQKLISLENINADVVLTQTPPLTVGITAHQLARKMKAKSVMVLQDLFVDSMVTKGKVKGPIKWALQIAEKISFRKSDALSTISEEMAQKIRAKVGDEKKPAVIPNFVDTSVYHPITEDHRAEYGLSADDFVISYVGNIGNAQDLMPLIELARNNKSIKILIAGNGTKEEEYRSIVDKEKLDTIRFLGYVTREESLKINSVSDICMIMLADHVLSTSFPSKTYSLMAMGKPIFITCNKYSTAGQFIEKNSLGKQYDVLNNGEFVKDIEQYLYNKELLSCFGKNGLEMVKQKYSTNVICTQYVDLFNKVKNG